MTREQRRDLIEAIGLVAIVASLLILALEVREANLSSRIAARDSATQGHLDVVGAGIDSSLLALVYAKLETNEALTPLDRSQLGIHYWHRWKHYERVYFLYDDGVLLDREWEGFRRPLISSLTGQDRAAELLQESWRKSRETLSSAFVQYVELELQKRD